MHAGAFALYTRTVYLNVFINRYFDYSEAIVISMRFRLLVLLETFPPLFFLGERTQCAYVAAVLYVLQFNPQIVSIEKLLPYVLC